MDEIQGGGLVGPFAGGVVNVETHVGRHPRGLDGREIGADNGGFGVFVGEVAVGWEIVVLVSN